MKAGQESRKADQSNESACHAEVKDGQGRVKIGQSDAIPCQTEVKVGQGKVAIAERTDMEAGQLDCNMICEQPDEGTSQCT